MNDSEAASAADRKQSSNAILKCPRQNNTYDSVRTIVPGRGSEKWVYRRSMIVFASTTCQSYFALTGEEQMLIRGRDVDMAREKPVAVTGMAGQEGSRG